MSLDRLNLLDMARRVDPDGRPAIVIETLNQSNPMLVDAPAFPSNAQMGNRVTMRSALPTVAFRKINQGSVKSKSATKVAIDTIGFIDGRCEVDIREKKILGDAGFAAQRRLENLAFVEAMSQKACNTLIYGNELNDEAAFTGLQPRLETAGTSILASQVAKHHSSPSGSDYTSIYVVDWGEQGAHIIYPRDGAGVVGLDIRDFPEQSVNDVDGNPFQAVVTIYEWMLGLTVKDPRRIARLANIDVSQALADTTTLIKASLNALINGMPQRNGMNRVIYCSRNILSAFENQIEAKTNVMFSWQEYLAEKMLHFKGIPIRACDQISEAETVIT